MAYSSPNYALAAKARAMFGRRITPQNYRELLRKQTVNEVAAYLKQQTSYSDVLNDVNENLIHRGQLENILKRNVYDEYTKMFHFIGRSDRRFYNYNVVQMEINEILGCLRYLNAGRQGDYIFSMPSFLAKHSSFDLYRFAKAKTMDELLEILKDTPYYEILKKYEAGSDGKIDTIALEVELRKYYYNGILELIGKNLKSNTRDEVKKSFGMEIDLENLMIILRLKKYFNSSNDYIRSLLMPYYFKVSEQEIDEIIRQPDADSTWKAIKRTRYGREFQKYSYESIEKYSQQVKYDFHRRLLLFSNTAPVIVVSYMELKRSELDNLINIIEGIRYSLPPSEISKLLVGTGE